MPSAHKFTFVFGPTVGNAGTAGARAGWSESWYDPAILTDQQCATNVGILAGYRRGLLTPGWSLEELRVSQLDANFNLLRKGLLQFFTPQDAPGRYSGNFVGISIDEQPYDALAIRINTVQGFRRGLSMRGIGQDVVTAGGRFANPAGFQDKFIPWTNAILGQIFNQFAGPYAVRFRSIRSSPLTPDGTYLVAGVDIGAGAFGGTPISPVITVVAGDGAPTYQAGDTVVIRGVLGLRALNGSWKIKQVGGGTVPATGMRLSPKRRVTVSGAYSSGGTIRAYFYRLDPILSLFPEYGTSRRTGRPFQLIRGRRSNQQP